MDCLNSKLPRLLSLNASQRSERSFGLVSLITILSRVLFVLKASSLADKQEDFLPSLSLSPQLLYLGCKSYQFAGFTQQSILIGEVVSSN